MSAAPESSGNRTVDSKPNMCCGGTVPKIVWRGPIARRRASAWMSSTSGPQCLKLGCGSPVEPEVKTQATRWSAGATGISTAGAFAGPSAISWRGRSTAIAGSSLT